MKTRFCIIVISIILMECTFAQVKKYIPIIEPKIHEGTKELFLEISNEFAENGYTEIAEIFKNFAFGGFGSGFIITDEFGNNFIITNKHVVSQADYADIKFQNSDGTLTVFQRCPIIYTDGIADIAVLTFPDNKNVFDTGLKLCDLKPGDGMEIWSAGYPGLIDRPMWQFSKGNITNANTSLPEVIDPNYTTLIQHSATIDFGSSGGPLLYTNTSNLDSLKVLGINTWTIGNRQNTFYAIPSTILPEILDRAKESIRASQDSELKRKILIQNCKIISAEFSSENPDFEMLRKYISYEFVSKFGWEAFINLYNQQEETQILWSKLFFQVSQIETMRQAIYYSIWINLFENNDKPKVRFKELNYADSIQFSEKKEIRTIFTINEEEKEINWIYEHGHWRISYYNFTAKKNRKSDDKRKKKNKTYDDIYYIPNED